MYLYLAILFLYVSDACILPTVQNISFKIDAPLYDGIYKCYRCYISLTVQSVPQQCPSIVSNLKNISNSLHRRV